MEKKKKPAGVGGQKLCLVTKRYMRGNVMVERTWIERRKVLNARKQNVAKPGEEKKLKIRLGTNFTNSRRVFECQFHPEQKETQNTGAACCKSSEYQEHCHDQGQ